MQLVILYHPKEVTVKEAAQYDPIAIVHHGGVTDSYWRSNRFQLVHDFVKEVKDAGVLAGVSCHEPEVMDRITDEDWENDLFMGCFYVMSRPEADWKKILGFKPIQSTFRPADPDRMGQSIRRTRKPCLGFKILAGGWSAGNPGQTEQAFKYAFQNIKPADGVIVGMLPHSTTRSAKMRATRSSTARNGRRKTEDRSRKPEARSPKPEGPADFFR